MPEIATLVHIDNIDEIVNAKHRCNNQNTLTVIQVGIAEMGKDIINLSAYFQELSAKIDENNAEQMKNWDRNWNRLDELEKAEHRRQGSGRWETWLLDIVKSVFVAIAVIVAAFLMSGGHIT